MTVEFDPTAILSTPEGMLTPAMLRQLPAEAAAAPWDARADAILWWGRADAGLERHLTPAIRAAGKPLLGIGAMLHYTQTPVGPYSEVLATTLLRGAAGAVSHCPFIAVDSPASVLGGRRNWALAKTLARFSGSPAERTMTAQGEQWTVRVSARSYGPALPLRLPGFNQLQQGAAGLLRMRVEGRARLRLARVRVEVSGGEALRAFLPSGSYWGVVAEPLNGWLGAAEACC